MLSLFHFDAEQLWVLDVIDLLAAMFSGYGLMYLTLSFFWLWYGSLHTTEACGGYAATA